MAKQANEQQVFDAKLTDAQLLKLGDTFAIANKVKAGAMGWCLGAIQMAHSIPSTHAQAVALAQRYTKLLLPAYDMALWPSVPKAHFGLVRGGIGGFKPAYAPNKFGTRTRTGFAWLCNEHGIQFDKCDATCLHGVAHGDSPTSKGKQAWLYTDVKPVVKPRAQRKATKATKVAKPNTDGPASEVESPSTETQATIDALNN